MSEVAELEQYKKDQQVLVEMRDAALRLSENRDFRKLILEGFCLHEAARYVQESGDPMLNSEQRADALHMAQASGHLKRFLSLTIVMGNTAANNVRQADQELDVIRSEGGDE